MKICLVDEVIKCSLLFFMNEYFDYFSFLMIVEVLILINGVILEYWM